MKKIELTKRTDTVINETKTALQTLWDSINKGQRKQLYKIPEIKEILDRYGVEVET